MIDLPDRFRRLTFRYMCSSPCFSLKFNSVQLPAGHVPGAAYAINESAYSYLSLYGVHRPLFNHFDSNWGVSWRYIDRSCQSWKKTTAQLTALSFHQQWKRTAAVSMSIYIERESRTLGSTAWSFVLVGCYTVPVTDDERMKDEQSTCWLCWWRPVTSREYKASLFSSPFKSLAIWRWGFSRLIISISARVRGGRWGVYV